MMARRGTTDAGFTLIELLIAIALTGVIVGPLGAALVVGFRSTSEANARLSESHDAQLATIYFSGDVQSADVIRPAEMCITGTPVVAFRWTEGTTGTVLKVASYEVATDAARGERQLLRHLCSTPGGTRTTIVAHNLSATDPPTARCDGSLCAPLSTARDVRLGLTAASGYTVELRGTRRTP